MREVVMKKEKKGKTEIETYLKNKLPKNDDLPKSIRGILEHFTSDDIRPRLTSISRKTGMPVTTLLDAWNRLVEQGRIRISIEIGVEETVKRIKFFSKNEEVLIKRK